MKRDRYRISGPENVIFPQFTASKNTFSNELLNPKMRKDKRSHQSCRSQFVKLNVLPQANGSAFMELGNTKVVCGVYILFIDLLKNI